MYRNSEKFGAKISMFNLSWYTHTWWVSESHEIIENLPFLDIHLPGSVGFIREVEHFDPPLAYISLQPAIYKVDIEIQVFQYRDVNLYSISSKKGRSTGTSRINSPSYVGWRLWSISSTTLNFPALLCISLHFSAFPCI